MLRLDNISVHLGGFGLRQISLEVAAGEYFVLMGMSGAGKSVLLQVIAGLITPTSGSVSINGKDITGAKIQKRGVGLVFQDSLVFPHMKVYNNIAYALRSKNLSRKDIRRKVLELSELTNTLDLLYRDPGSLSGGERQRVALARALALKPACLLLDEPLSSVDVWLRGELRSLLREINRNGQTILHVTHDYEEAAMLAHRIGVIEHGSISQTGTPQEVFHHPGSEFVARFVGIRNFFRGTLRSTGGSLKTFYSSGLDFSVLTDEPEGEGCIMIRGEDVIVSEARTSTSAVNHFEGKVQSLEPARVGVEVQTDIGLPLFAHISLESARAFNLHPGKKVWVSFKASAVKYMGK